MFAKSYSTLGCFQISVIKHLTPLLSICSPPHSHHHVSHEHTLLDVHAPIERPVGILRLGGYLMPVEESHVTRKPLCAVYSNVCGTTEGLKTVSKHAATDAISSNTQDYVQ